MQRNKGASVRLDIFPSCPTAEGRRDRLWAGETGEKVKSFLGR